MSGRGGETQARRVRPILDEIRHAREAVRVKQRAQPD